MGRYYKILDFWRDNGPPVYMSVAGYLGLIKGNKKKGSSPTKAKPDQQKPQGNDLNELIKLAGPGGMIN